MHVIKDKAERLLELTSQKYLDRNINRFVDKGYMDGYEDLLKDIAQNSKYNEGEKITNSDLSRIKNAVVATLDGMRKMMVEQPLTLEEIKAVVIQNFDKSVEFIEVPEAEQYRTSLKMKVGK